jgi:hypothetical protein
MVLKNRVATLELPTNYQSKLHSTRLIIMRTKTEKFRSLVQGKADCLS